MAVQHWGIAIANLARVVHDDDLQQQNFVSTGAADFQGCAAGRAALQNFLDNGLYGIEHIQANRGMSSPARAGTQADVEMAGDVADQAYCLSS